jgi:bacterioferritin
MNKQTVIKKLNEMMNIELNGAMKYIQYSYFVFGVRRKPIVEFLREQAEESIGHAMKVGDKIVALGGNPTVTVNEDLKARKITIEQILKESILIETKALNGYMNILKDVEDDVVMDGFIRDFVTEESGHLEEVEKMIRE